MYMDFPVPIGRQLQLLCSFISDLPFSFCNFLAHFRCIFVETKGFGHGSNIRFYTCVIFQAATHDQQYLNNQADISFEVSQGISANGRDYLLIRPQNADDRNLNVSQNIYFLPGLTHSVLIHF